MGDEITPEQAAQAAALLVTQQGRLAVEEKLVEMGKQNNTVTQTAAGLFDKLKTSVSQVSNEALGVSRTFGSLFKEMSEFNDLSDVINGTKEAIVSLGEEGLFALMPLLNILPTTRDLFGEVGRSGMKAGSDITESFSKLTELPIFKGMPGMDSIGPKLNRLFSSADQARNLELGLLSIATASGSLNDVLAEAGDNFSGLSDYTANYNERINQVAASSGMLSTTVQNYAANLAKIPGALNTVIQSSGNATGTMNMLDASIKVASAFQIDHKEIVDQLNYAYRNFNTTGDKALEFVARMAQTAQNLHMPLDIVRETTLRSASAFKLMGDNSQAAINVLSRVGGALGKSLGAEGIQEITNGMINGVNQMDLATKSFISASSGGPGGIAGGFQMDMLIKEGKMDEVLQKTMMAMQNQFKGPTLTLEDAANNPAQSGEFLKQVSFIKDVAKLANTDQQAYRVLELMKKGGLGSGEELAKMRQEPQQVLQNTLDRGTRIQEQGFTGIINVMNQLLRVEQVSAAASLSLTQKLIGTKNEGNLGAGLIDRMQEGGQKAAVGAKSTAEDTRNDIMEPIMGVFEAVKKFGLESMDKFGGFNFDKPTAENTGQLPQINNSTTNINQTNGPDPNRVLTGSNLTVGMPVSNVTPPQNDLRAPSNELLAAINPSNTKGIKPVMTPETAESIMALPAVENPKMRGGKPMADGSFGSVNNNEINGTMTVEVNIKDGVTTIAKAAARSEMKDMLQGSYNGINKRTN